GGRSGHARIPVHSVARTSRRLRAERGARSLRRTSATDADRPCRGAVQLMAGKRVPLYERLPEIYRIRDVEIEPAGQLKAYLSLGRGGAPTASSSGSGPAGTRT